MESLNSDLFLYEAAAFRLYRNAAFNLLYYPAYKPIIVTLLWLITNKKARRGLHASLFYILFNTMKLIPLFARLYSEPAA